MAVFDLSEFCGHRFKNGGLYAGRAAKSLEDTRQSKHQLALRILINLQNRRQSVVHSLSV